MYDCIMSILHLKNKLKLKLLFTLQFTHDKNDCRIFAQMSDTVINTQMLICE